MEKTIAGIKIGRNVYLSQEADGIYCLRWDSTADGPVSKTSGKTVVLASTGRGFNLNGQTVAVNIYKPVEVKIPGEVQTVRVPRKK